MNQLQKTEHSMSPESRPPLVAIVANYPEGTGYAWWLMERFWNEISNNANKRGWQSIVIYPQSPQDENLGCDSSNLSQLEAFLSKGKLKDINRIYQLIRHFNIRSLYLTDRPFRSWKYFLFRLAGINSIIVHDHTPGDRPAITGLKGIIKYLLNSLTWFTASLYIAISPLMRQRHLLNARIPAAQITTVTNGIEVRDLIPKARELLIEKFRLAPDSFIICAVGRLNAYKRFDFAINCVASLAHEHPQIHPVLILIGDGPDRQHLQGLTDSLPPECKVIFAGQINDVWPLLCGVDTVIHPSAGEGLSLAILEAMAAARPVAVPSLASVSQTIEHGYNGLIYQEGSIDDAERLLSRLSSDKMFRTSLGANARTTVLEKYRLDRAISDFNETVLPVIFQSISNSPKSR